jgi:hypothetical protein
VRWHRAGFKLYWTWLSRHRNRLGRKSLSRELRELIFRMVAENTTWGVPRIRGELKMLGFDISERSVLRWMRKAETVNISLNISILKWSALEDDFRTFCALGLPGLCSGSQATNRQPKIPAAGRPKLL